MKKIYTTVLLGLMCFVTVQSQEQLSNRQKATAYLNSYQYGKAILLYQKITDVKEPKLEDMENLAYCYNQINQYELASNWYSRVVEHSDSPTENLLLYASTLKQTSRYAEAKSTLKRYAETTGKHNEVAIEIAGCDAAIKWMANPLDYKIKNEEGINTPMSEFGTYPLADDIYYIGEDSESSKLPHLSWTGNTFLQVFKANINGTGLSKAEEQNIPFNKDSKFHVGPITSNKTGDVFYVTRTYSGKKGEKVKNGKTRYTTNKLELYIYTKEGDTWKHEPFVHNNIKHHSVGHAALSPDEQTLYFVSDMDGSVGGTDIWFSIKQADGTWGPAINAGTTINGPKDEMFPSIADDGTLYFSSNSFVGMGGLDLFKAEGSKNVWNKPENLQYPVNSGGDDFAYVISEKQGDLIKGFLSSNRNKGKGGDDIYSFNYQQPKMVIMLEGTTYEGNGTNKVLPDVKVSLYNNGQNEILTQKVSESNGFFIFKVEPDTEYKLLGQKQKFYSDSLTVNTKGISNDTIRVSLHLKPLFEIGSKIVLQDIYYDFDKYNIRSDAQVILHELVRIMHDNPTLKIELSSHTDSRGSDPYNMVLSQKRAQSAVDYILSRGVSRERLTAQGYGETQLVNRCSNGVACSKEEHQQNRRTEVKVLEF